MSILPQLYLYLFNNFTVKKKWNILKTLSVPCIFLSKPEPGLSSSLASGKIFPIFLGFHCKVILSMSVTKMLVNFCQSSYQPHGYFRENETKFFTVLTSPELLKLVQNVCDLLSGEEFSRDKCFKLS